MQKTSKKKRVFQTNDNLSKAAHRLYVYSDSNSHLSSTLRLERSATLSIANRTRGAHLILGPVAAVTALRIAQIDTQARIALHQLSLLASILSGNYCCNNELSRVVSTHLALLGLLNRQQVAAGELKPTTNYKSFAVSQRNLLTTMYHQRPQQSGSQRFPNAPRLPLLPTPPNQHTNCSNVQGMAFPFPRPTQLPDELESALSIRGTRDMDHRQMDQVNKSNHSTGPVVGQHGGFGSKPVSLSHSAENQSGHQQGMNWSNYPPPKKLFANPPPSVNLQGSQQQTQNRQLHSGGGDGQNVYTPESAGSILASFGLSNEDLEVLSHYPDDQLTPDTLPFILRDIQINKSGQQKNVASISSTSFSHNIHEMPALASSASHPPEVLSLLTVTQTAGKVIDYGHASRGNDESTTRETFKREQLSSERSIKMYPTSSSSTVSKVDKSERRQVRLERKEPNKLEDRDYRRTSSEKRRSSRSPGRQYPLPPKSRNLDRDYRQEASKPSSTSETRSDSASRHSVASSMDSQPSSSKKLPTPTMISDFSAMPPKVYPHTCSLCHEQCDEEKDWVDHVNTVNHTSACRDLRNRYPDWKPNPSSRSGRYGSRALWDPKDGSPFRSHSRSPSPSSRRRLEARSHGPRSRPYISHHHPRPYHFSERSHRYDTHHYGSHTSSYVHRTSSSSFRGYPPDRRSRDSAGGYSHGAVKRPHDEGSSDSHRNPPSSSSASSKHGSSKNIKDTTKPITKTTKAAVKPPPAKKKKKVVTPATQDFSFVDRLVYLTGIPTDASEQEVTDMVGAFGKINNVILMPCSEEESEKGQGQKASVCMVKAEDALALASSSNLHIRNQEISASVAKKQEDGDSSDSNSKLDPEVDQSTTVKNSAGGEGDQKTVEQNCRVLVSGLPESGWSKNDILELTQPFGTPSEVIVAANVGKALVFMNNVEVAEEMVKVHTFKMPKIHDCEVKMRHLKQNISLSTPVALYNLFMAAADPSESPVLVSWNSLLVIKNVPDSSSGSSEVLKLVRRFGTVIKTLVLDNMVKDIICEMATAAMSLSVYKRFLMFPCMIQSNPLFFSRKPDPKASTQAKAFSVSHDAVEDKPANGEDNQAAAAAAPAHTPAPKEDATVCEDNLEPPLEKMEEDDKIRSTETAEESITENESKEEIMETGEHEVPESAATPASEPQAPVLLETNQISAEKTEVKADGGTPQVDNGLPPNAEEAQTAGSPIKPDCPEPAMPELPKMTQAMVDALLVECKTRHASRAGIAEVPPSGEQEKAQVKTEESTEQANKPTVKEEAKKQDRERKEREVRKEKEKEERKRRVLEKEWVKQKTVDRLEKPREKKERKEEEKKEWERRERDKKEWRRAHNEGSSGWRSSHRSESNKQSSRRDDRYSAASKTTKVEEEEEEEFSFNLSDFVTVDEVGEVLDLPGSFPPAVPLETSEDATSTAVEEPPEEKPKEAEEIPLKSPVTESEQASVLTPQTSNGLAPTDGTTSLAMEAEASQDHPSEVEPVEPKAPDGDAQRDPDASVPPPLVSAPEVEPPPAPSQSINEGAATAERKEENEGSHPVEPQTEKEVDAMNDVKEQMSKEEKKGAEGQSANTEAVKPDKTDDIITKETTTELPLPPYDPHQPVGMEYLIPKTGFFCKVCSRFFTGEKTMEINHCKTRKHYESLQKFLQTKASTVKTD